MKPLLTLTILMSTTLSFAGEVKVTSFQFLGNSRIAELCGTVKGDSTQGDIIEVVSDPKMNRPGHYATVLSKTANFCLVIRTFSGEAEVTYGKQEAKLFKALVAK